jgi:hypothetical protein
LASIPGPHKHLKVRALTISNAEIIVLQELDAGELAISDAEIIALE